VSKVLLTVGLLILVPIALAAGALWLNRVPLFAAPGFLPRLHAYLGSNSVRLDTASAYPELRGVEIDGDAGTVLRRVKEACRSLGWEIAEVDEDTYTVHAVVTTSLLHFKDDIRIRLEPLDRGRVRLAARSDSRVGRGDFGANTRHLVDLVETLCRAPAACTRVPGA
jgi:uncharacterized protein (DUF1499 family)